MKTIDFLRVLKKMIREEVQQAVRTELRVLTEGKTITSNTHLIKNGKTPAAYAPTF